MSYLHRKNQLESWYLVNRELSSRSLDSHHHQPLILSRNCSNSKIWHWARAKRPAWAVSAGFAFDFLFPKDSISLRSSESLIFSQFPWRWLDDFIVSTVIVPALKTQQAFEWHKSSAECPKSTSAPMTLTWHSVAKGKACLKHNHDAWNSNGILKDAKRFF